MMELLDKCVKSLGGRADAEEKRNLNKNKENARDETDDGKDDSFGKDVGYAKCNTEEHCKYTHPKTVEVSTNFSNAHSSQRFDTLGWKSVSRVESRGGTERCTIAHRYLIDWAD